MGYEMTSIKTTFTPTLPDLLMTRKIMTNCLRLGMGMVMGMGMGIGMGMGMGMVMGMDCRGGHIIWNN